MATLDFLDAVAKGNTNMHCFATLQCGVCILSLCLIGFSLSHQEGESGST